MASVQSYRERVGWGFGLLRLAWMLPVIAVGMAVLQVALRLIEMLVRSGSPVLMVAAGVAGVVLVGAALRSRAGRAFLNRPRIWWLRALGVFSCAVALGLAAGLLWALKSGALGARH